MIGELQEHLAVLGRVPWVLGGDWNMQPDAFRSMWNRGGHVKHADTPTQQFGGNLDGFLTSELLVTGTPQVHATPGTDHTAISITVSGNQHNTLGYRLVTPKGYTPAQLDQAKVNLAGQPTQPPSNWSIWSREPAQSGHRRRA